MFTALSKAARRRWHQHRVRYADFEITHLQDFLRTYGERIEGALRRRAAAQWDLTAVDRPPITHASGRPRRDGKIRSVTGD